MNLTGTDLEIQATQNLAVVALGRSDMQVLDSKQRFTHRLDSTAPVRITPTAIVQIK